jgi:hypothetical protein
MPSTKKYTGISIAELWRRRQNFGGDVKERKIEITVETHEILFITRRDRLSRIWCESCGKRVAVISLNVACESGLNIETARRRIMNGQLHMIDSVNGSPFICLNSLFQN